MIVTRILALVAALLLAAPRAQAHFVWIDAKPGAADALQAELYFSELPEPGEPHLIAKIGQTKAWVRTAGATRELPSGVVDEKSAAIKLPTVQESAASFEAHCDYGLFERGPAVVLLQYSAKHLHGDWQSAADKLAQAERLPLDIVPAITGDKLNLQVLFQGKPSAGSEVIVIDPAGEGTQTKTDAEGRAAVKVTTPGALAVRAAHREPERGGERDGKKYTQTWHYCTLTLDTRPRVAPTGEASAAELLCRARSARAIWKDFPGFTADVTALDGGTKASGRVTIDAAGHVTLDMPASGLATWLEEQMRSLVQHRMPDGEIADTEVTYADQERAHPLGRKIDLGDPSLESVYRVKDDMIMEVNRLMGQMRFTISVLEFTRNHENKYLPRAFTMNFFDADSGQLQASLAYWNDWQRVGDFDLPRTIVEVSAKKGGATTRQFSLANCKLAQPHADPAR